MTNKPSAEAASGLNDGLGARQAFERAAQRCRYYLKHQNYPTWDNASEYERGVMVACEALESIMLEEAGKVDA